MRRFMRFRGRGLRRSYRGYGQRPL